MNVDATGPGTTKIDRSDSPGWRSVEESIRKINLIARTMLSNSLTNEIYSAELNGISTSDTKMNLKKSSRDIMRTAEDNQMDLGLAYERLFEAQKKLREAAVNLAQVDPSLAVEIDETTLGVYNIRLKVRDFLEGDLPGSV